MAYFLVYGLTPRWGGVEAIVLSMVHHLSDNNYFDIILQEGSSSYENQFQNDHVHFVHLPAWGGSRNLFIKGLKSLLKKNDYNYLWFNGCIMSNRDIIKVTNRYSKAKIITHSHGSSFEEGNIIKRLVLLLLHKYNRPYFEANVDYPCMCSRKSGLWFYGQKYIENHHVHHIKNGVDTSRYCFNADIRIEYRTKLGLTDEIALFHAGRLTKVKNQQRILSIFADFLAEGFKAKLFIAGDGELRSELEDQAEILHITDKVHFLGIRNDVNNLYQAMDVMLLPSFHEGFPVTLTEAQATGLPCLVSDRVSQETNIIGLVDFLSIDLEDNKQWVAALKEIVDKNSADRNKYMDLFCKAGYDIKTVCDDFLQFVEA